VAGLATALGSGSMTNSIAEIGEAATILAVGTNTTQAHPVLALQVKKAARNGARLIVANPKKIDLCRHATLHLQHRPGTDVPLLMGMARVIADEGLADMAFIKARCENYDAFLASLVDFAPERVAAITGVPAEQIVAAARMYAGHGPASILYCMGITQHSHGTDNVWAVSNLALLTGNLGKYASGVNPLRGQNNVQGSCDMGGLPNVYTGYQQVNDPKVREKFESAWGVSLSPDPGLTLGEVFDGMHAGTIKSLYLVGENPVLTEANANHAIAALKNLEFLVVQDIFLTETAQLADVVFPAATFAEKDGTFTNTERRIQRVRQAIAPRGESKPDWHIVAELARKMGAKGFDFSGPEEIMVEIASLTPSYGGISYPRLEGAGLQWPCPDKDHPGTPTLHVERFGTASGKAKMIPLVFRDADELPDEEYPLLLTTDRSLFHYHSGSMTRRVAGLEQLNSEELLKINPRDAQALGLVEKEMVQVTSRRGTMTVRTSLSQVCPPGLVSMTFHFAESPTNVLTNPARDPVAKIPETKVCAVRVEKM
jgi:formate dehydrogenase (NADP+) alpha subunit